MRQSHLILSNAAVMWATRALLLIPQLILVPYLIGTIGETGYGVYALIWSLLLSIDQLERSLQSGVVKYSAGFLAQGRLGEVNRAVSSSFVYSLGLAGLASGGTLVGAALYRDPSGQVGSALAVVAIMLLLIIPLTPFVAVIQSRQRYYVGAIADTAAKYLSLLVVMAWFQWLGPSVEALIIITAGMLFLARLVQVPVAYRLVDGLRCRPQLFDRASFRQIASFGAVTVLASLCLAVNSTGVRWLMDTLASTRFVAHLAILLMPSLLLAQVVSPMTITAMPATSAYEATGNRKMLQELLVRGMRYTTILVLAGLLAAGVLLRVLLSLWVGAGYAFLAPYALALFASAAFLQSTSIAHHMLKGLGKLRTVLGIYLVALALVPVGAIVALTYLGVDPYLAVTIGLSAGNLMGGAAQIFLCAKAVQADLRDVLVRSFAQPLLVAAVTGLLAYGAVAALGPDGLVGRGIVAVLAVLLFLAGCYFIISTSSEREEAAGALRWVIRRIGVSTGGAGGK